MNKFTCIGYYEEEDQVVIDHIDAPTALEAKITFLRGREYGGLCWIATFEGYLTATEAR